MKNCLILTPATNKTPNTEAKITADEPRSGCIRIIDIILTMIIAGLKNPIQ